MGRGSSKAGKGRGGGNSVTSLNGITDGSNEQNLAWVKGMRPGISDADAQATVDAAYSYSTNGYHEMHMGAQSREADLLNNLIDSPKTPVYNGVTYRGISLDSKDAGIVDAALKSGRWKEPGVSSFTTKKFIADTYSGSKGVSVIIKNVGGTKGMPFEHLTFNKGEGEVLQSAKTMKKGLKITSHRTRTSSDGKKTVYITVDDSK